MTTHVAKMNEEELQRLLAEAYEGVPRNEPTPEQIAHMAAMDAEQVTEGRTFKHRSDPKGE